MTGHERASCLLPQAELARAVVRSPHSASLVLILPTTRM
jgi:hypothetical protein